MPHPFREKIQGLASVIDQLEALEDLTDEMLTTLMVNLNRDLLDSKWRPIVENWEKKFKAIIPPERCEPTNY